MIRNTDLGLEEDVIVMLSEGEGKKCNAVIMGTTRFSDAPDQGILDKLKDMFSLAMNAQGTIDTV